jgi:predicted enzyme related to lactoylglutathione lyase
MSHIFVGYDLRTTDPDAAQAFYSGVLGRDITQGDGDPTSILSIWPLPEQARARGAPAHWLGQIGVHDVEATARRWVELGGERLGPMIHTKGRTAFAVVRDPEGAVVAVRATTERPLAAPVAWHQLHARDRDRAWAIYAELFGWTHTETLEATGLPGGLQMFAWDDSGTSVGGLANTARMPGVHAHWLYCFRVEDLDRSVAEVRAKGGTVGNLAVLPSGDRIAPCEDPQRAAFGLLQSAS